jgi:hypothetical protein
MPASLPRRARRLAVDLARLRQSTNTADIALNRLLAEKGPRATSKHLLHTAKIFWDTFAAESRKGS